MIVEIDNPKYGVFESCPETIEIDTDEVKGVRFIYGNPNVYPCVVEFKDGSEPLRTNTETGDKIVKSHQSE